MFYYLDGTVALLDNNLAVIDCGGVGYACNTTAFTIASLKVGNRQKLYTYCHVKEDAFDIYGFSSREEQRCFLQLLCVSGVGPKAALSILSAVTPEQFVLAVVTGDEKTLTMAQGVGKKMAQRIILELKDKLAGEVQSVSSSAISAVPVAMTGGKVAEATAALASLGYSHSEIGVALKGVDTESLPVEEIVRQALRAMVMQ